MKKTLLLLALCLVLLLAFSGCTQKAGYVVRYDITTNDLGYFFSGAEPRLDDIAESDMLDVLGLPHRGGYLYDCLLYEYFFDEGVVGFATDESDNLRAFSSIYIDWDTENEENVVKETAEKSIDAYKYTMEIRHDIDIKDIAFINDKTTSCQLQQELGAPYKMASGILKDPMTNVFMYELDDKNLLHVIYQRGGQVAGAWVEDDAGNKIQDIVPYE